VEENVAFDSIHIGLFGVLGEMLGAEYITPSIQQFLGFGHYIFSEVYAKIKTNVHPILPDCSLMPN
jgi:hypothetical protein